MLNKALLLHDNQKAILIHYQLATRTKRGSDSSAEIGYYCGIGRWGGEATTANAISSTAPTLHPHSKGTSGNQLMETFVLIPGWA